MHRNVHMNKYVCLSSKLSCCVGHTLAGVEDSYACFCGGTIGNAERQPESECNMTCPGDISQTCGGALRLNLYNATLLGEL